MRRNFFICLLLAGITLAIYWPARNYDIVYYDDTLFVTENPEITAGLNWHSFEWAMASTTAANWHPVTSFSFVLTHQFFGINPGAEHLVNVLFHTANAVLLFLVLNRMTGATWRSAIVAAIFAWHPLRVESVAWISERKDVLFAFFMLLALWAYARFVELKNQNSKRKWIWHGLALLAFVLGFMSKAMIVTLPFLLLLLDFWPLKRMTNDGFRMADLKPLVLEKIPFFVLAIFFSWLTFWIQKNHGAVVPLERLGLMDRAGHAVSSYVQYLDKFFWPANLVVMYPYQNSHAIFEIWLDGLLLLAVSALCVCQLRRRPYLAVGWFWYLGTALPIIGLVQVGDQAMADRYTYLPLIGPTVALVWTAAEIFSRSRVWKMILPAAAILILSALAILSELQLRFWRNTIDLFEHNIAVTPENASAYYTLGLGLEYTGDTRHAILCYRVAKAINPMTFARQNLADLLSRQGLWSAAESECKEVLAIDPDDVPAHMSLSGIFAAQGRMDESLFQLNEVVRLNPDFAEALNNLAWALATSPDPKIRDGARAIQLAEHACELTDYHKTIYIGTLAAAYAEAGRFDDAISTAQKACDLAEKSGQKDLLQRNQELLQFYRAHKPYHEPAEKLVPDAK
jgi:tetratricopeptide (TPR) repeat protein